jgi:anti-anti-sigma regulatory factor
MGKTMHVHMQTMQKYTKTVHVAIEIARNVSSRNQFILYEEILEKNQSIKIIFDFTDVEFISRSAAHALLTLRDSFRERVRFSNLNSSFERLISLTDQSKGYRQSKISIEHRDLPQHK